MLRQKITIAGTATAVLVTSGIFATLSWQDASYVAAVVSALAAVATLGLSLFLMFRKPSTLKAENTGKSESTYQSCTNTGITVRGKQLSEDLKVDRTGDATASDGSQANSGIDFKAS